MPLRAADRPASPPNGNPGQGFDPAEWVDAHGDILFRFAVMRVRSVDIAEDLLQETFLSALTNRAQFRGQSSVRTWLVSILRHKITDHLRQKGRAESLAHPADLSRLPPRARPAGGQSSDPAQQLEQADFWRIFHECNQKLAEHLAEAYYLREICELSREETCRVLGISAGNLAQRLFRARAALRRCLGENWFGTD